MRKACPMRGRLLLYTLKDPDCAGMILIPDIHRRIPVEVIPVTIALAVVCSLLPVIHYLQSKAVIPQMSWLQQLQIRPAIPYFRQNSPDAGMEEVGRHAPAAAGDNAKITIFSLLTDSPKNRRACLPLCQSSNRVQLHLQRRLPLRKSVSPLYSVTSTRKPSTGSLMICTSFA